MAQWGQQQGQPGYQYPMAQPQTGFNPQQTGFNPQQQFQQLPQQQFQPQQGQFQAPLNSQPTGYGMQQQPQRPMMPQQTGFIQSQPTGFPGGSNFQQRAPPPPPVPSLPMQYQQQNQGNPLANNNNLNPGSSFLGTQPQINRFLSPSPGPLTAQPIGFQRPLVPQMTGFVDPRLQMMSSTFLPASGSTPYAPQFQSMDNGMSLQQSFQQHNQSRGGAPPRVPWALSKAEKKSYDTIFRAWDGGNTGFISGQVALEVFGQSGLGKDDLARIWTLADVDDRGKLNMAEFHIAMGLIYRKLNGNEIPEQLPAELVPPSSRALEDSVHMLTDLLKHESNSRTTSSVDSPVSYGKNRSLVSGSGGNSRGPDGTVYKYNEDNMTPPGGFYKPASRHVDRNTVRSKADEENPVADLEDLKRQMENTAKQLEQSVENDASRTKEDDALEREMSNLRMDVKHIQEDLGNIARGPRTAAKDDERNRLERKLLGLMHERLPELERRITDREARKEREKREWGRERDRRNERFGVYDRDRYSDDRDRDRDRDRPSSRYQDRDDDRGYSSRYDRDDRDRRSASRGYNRRESPPPVVVRSPPPAPSSTAPASSISQPPPPAPRPTASPAPAMTNMTMEERRAFARAEAQRRVEARKLALGVTVPTSSPGSPAIDTTVEDRLAEERRVAMEKAKAAEAMEETRQNQRQARLQSERADREGSASKPTPTPTVMAAPPVPTPTVTAKKVAPPPPKPRNAPPAPAPRAVVAPPRAPPAPAPVVVAPVVQEPDPEEEALRAREEQIKKQREARAARLRLLEQEEEEARLAEEEYANRRKQFMNKPKSPSPEPIAPIVQTPPAPAPAPPTPPVVAASPPVESKSSTNPFSKLIKEGSGPAATASSTSANPWGQPAAAPPPPPPPAPGPSVSAPRSVPAPSKSPAPTYHTAPTAGDSDADDWGKEPDGSDDDSSDDEYTSSRQNRANIAKQLFGSILPGASNSRPSSAAGNGNLISPSTPGASGSAGPPPPPPPPAPVFKVPVATGPADTNALMRSIQGGMKLKKTVTVDKSAPPVSGKVLGDTAPPAHINIAPRPVSPPSHPQPQPEPESEVAQPESASVNNNRQSVDWYAGLAADQGGAAAANERQIPVLPATTEEDENDFEDVYGAKKIPDINVTEVAQSDVADDAMADIDFNIQYRVRSLYAYQGQRPEDLSFAENVILIAHPSKTQGDWWYGTSADGQNKGFFPHSYVQELENVKARAEYAYTGDNPDELAFVEGDVITIIDRSEDDWWKTEVDGIVLIVPAAYLQLVGQIEGNADVTPSQTQEVIDNVTPAPVVPLAVSDADTASDNEDEEATDSDYLSFNSDEEDPSDESEDGEARENERRRVLEAAGLLIVNQDGAPRQPNLVRATSKVARSGSVKRHRRPAPAAPRDTANRESVICSSASISSSKELPPTPTTIGLDDAFDRYQSFQRNRAASNPVTNRLSVASSTMSSDTAPPSPKSSIATATTHSSSSIGERHSASGILHGMFGRSKTPTADSADGSGRPVRPTISGPISMVHGSDIKRENSPTFGTSWASLVDKTVLQGIPNGERRRQEAIFELITTEGDYVRDLQLVVGVFYSTLLPLLDSKAATVVFANIEDILLTNTAFVSALEERQKDCRLYIDHIGDILTAHMVNMGVYLDYCVNQATAIKVLKSLRDTEPALANKLQHIRDTDPTVRNLDLSSYLLAPMQRVTKYPLLIRQILHHTEGQEQERKEIERALTVSEKLLSRINETIREQEGRERLSMISKNLWIGQGRLDLTAPTRYMGPRHLLREGYLVKAKSGRKLLAFLCTDIIVLTDEGGKSLYRMPIPLAEVQTKEVTGGKDDLSFQLTQPYPRGGETIVFKATSPRDCELWKNSIDAASRRCREAMQPGKPPH